MKLLMVATGYLPYLFSENLCNGKLVYALREAGVEVDVITKEDGGPTYGKEWVAPWDVLKDSTHEITYAPGSILVRVGDTFWSALLMDGHLQEGIRWARRAYQKAVDMIRTNHYDAVITRSPNDISHLVGYMLKKKYGIKWIANWNDPATPIWPEPYKHEFSPRRQRAKERATGQLLAAADINTFPSDTLRQHFIKHFPVLKDSVTAVLPHIGLSESVFKSHPRKSGDVMYMCHSGNMSGERNPELTFKAMRQLIDEDESAFHLDIMGHSVPETEELIKKYRLEDFVSLIGGYPYLEAVDRLQDYDVLVLLEAILDRGIFFASKITDYAQTGRPILAISPKEGFARNLIDNYHAGLHADNTDVDSIKGAIKELIGRWREGTLDEISSKAFFEEVKPTTVVNRLVSLVTDQN